MKPHESTPEICLWALLALNKLLQTISGSTKLSVSIRLAVSSVSDLKGYRIANMTSDAIADQIIYQSLFSDFHFMQDIPDDFSYARLTSYFDTPQIAAAVRSPDCLLGMLTAVASAPADLVPEDWLGLIFRDEIEENSSMHNPEKWLDGLIQELIGWWLYCLLSFDEGGFLLPEHLSFDDNGTVPQALKEFAEGYIIASDWSDELWQAAAPDEQSMENGLRMAALTALAQCVKEELRNEDGMPDLVAEMISAQREDVNSDSSDPALTLESLLYSVGHMARQLSVDLEQTQEPYINPNRDVGRNDPCPCGSGKKFKKCCMRS